MEIVGKAVASGVAGASGASGGGAVAVTAGGAGAGAADSGSRSDQPSVLQKMFSEYVHAKLWGSSFCYYCFGPVQMLSIDEQKILRARYIDVLEVTDLVSRHYPTIDLASVRIEIHFSKVWLNLKMQQLPDRYWLPVTHEDLAVSFERPFVGDADVLFREYVARCCVAYDDHPDDYTSPCMTLAQSSSFGKSRLLYSLAQATKNSEKIVVKCDGEAREVEMRVLYVCESSSGYPLRTRSLRKWLFEGGFSKDRVASRLKTVYEYALLHWADVGETWLSLFSDWRSSDPIVEYTLSTFDESPSSTSTTRFPHKGYACEPLKVLVLAIDGASTLLDYNNIAGESYYHLLQRALVTAAESCSIFAVFVNALPQNGSITSPLETDTLTGTPFPPFVLNQPTDQFSNCSKAVARARDYKASVLNRSLKSQWKSLIRMGRPLWAICDIKQALYQWLDPVTRMVMFASSTLLRHGDPRFPSKYTARNLHGVATILCRLGLRPHPSSRLATRGVVDLMSVLHYVNYGNRGYTTSYPSDPVLAFGSENIWCQLKHKPLGNCILPQFTELLLQEEISDEGGTGEFVARIFLLLAIDSLSYEVHARFHSVSKFLEALGGLSPGFECVGQSLTSKSCRKKANRWLYDWSNWKMHFTQFVSLQEMPTKQTLWYLLSRRAAGVLPRDRTGVHLIIPMFCGERVSFMLVQINNKVSRDKAYRVAATTKLNPQSVFGKQHELGRFSPKDVIRVYMSLREQVADDETRCYIIEKSPLRPTRLSLCLRGVFQPREVPFTYWKFMNANVWKQLQFIANLANRDPRCYVVDDLQKLCRMNYAHRLQRVLSIDDALECARRTIELVPTMRKWSCE